MSLDELMKEDFIESSMAVTDLTEEEVLKIWQEEGEKYLSRIYDFMSDEVMFIVNNRVCSLKLT